MLAFGLDIINYEYDEDEDRRKYNGLETIYVRYYPLPLGVPNVTDQPIVRLAAEDEKWRDFYLRQFDYHWDGGLAEELPANYS
jgi:hypothetical protein